LESSLNTSIHSVIDEPLLLLHESVDHALLNLVPTGSLIAFGASDMPVGFLAANGSALCISDYARLFVVIGYTFGSLVVNDSNCTDQRLFLLPDTRGRAIVGSGQGTLLTPRNVGDFIGSESVMTDVTVLNNPIVPAHFHGVGTLNIASGGMHAHTDAGHAHGVNDPGHSHVPNRGSNRYTGHGANVGMSREKNDPDWKTSTSQTGVTIQSNAASIQPNTHAHPTTDFAGSVGYSTGGVSGDSPIETVGLKLQNNLLSTVTPGLVLRHIIKY
jgi:microcystin-dependent protein